MSERSEIAFGESRSNSPRNYPLELSEQEFRILHQLRYSDDPPACDEGIELLVQFAKAALNLYDLAARVDFIDPVRPGYHVRHLAQPDGGAGWAGSPPRSIRPPLRAVGSHRKPHVQELGDQPKRRARSAQVGVPQHHESSSARSGVVPVLGSKPVKP